MRHAGLLAPIGLLLTLVGCETDPALYEGEVYDDSVYELTATPVRLLEICNDGKDNDGDYKIDKADPDCGALKAPGSTLGYEGSIADGTDIHPGWKVSMVLDGKPVTIEHRTSALVVKTSTGTVLATIYTDTQAVAVGIGKRSTTSYNDILVVTSGGGAGYAPGRVSGTYDMDESAIPRTTPTGSTPSTPTVSTICTTGC